MKMMDWVSVSDLLDLKDLLQRPARLLLLLQHVALRYIYSEFANLGYPDKVT
jgi:hypothetical protein